MKNSESPTKKASPFIKWVGGKKQLLPQLMERLPKQFAHYYEPFVGGGAFFFALHNAGRIGRATLSDLNGELIATYNAVRSAPELLTIALGAMPYGEQFFYTLRQQQPDTMTAIEIAARMIYLNKTGFNGLYRVNRQGQFNAPFGHHKTPPNYVDGVAICSASAALANAIILNRPFDAVGVDAKAGDFVYFDPPYVPVSKTANFTAYQSGGFGMEQQTRLRDLCLTLHERGVFVMVSNSDAQAVRELYGGAPFCISEVMAKRAINCKGDGRGAVGELIITNY